MHDALRVVSRRCLRGTLSALALTVVSLSAAGAHAEELASRQNLVFSAERLFGLYINNVTVDEGGRDNTTHHTLLGLGWSAAPNVSALTFPRLGIDYFIGSGLTLGGNVGVVSATTEGVTTTGLLLGARVGYAVRLGHSVTLWPRGGLAFALLEPEGAARGLKTFALSFDVPFAFAPTEGFAFLLGPTLDLGIVGERGDNDASELLFGLMIGLCGWTGL
jgi:hypothetical protein